MFFFRAVICLLIQNKIYLYIAHQRKAGNQLKKILPVQLLIVDLNIWLVHSFAFYSLFSENIKLNLLLLPLYRYTVPNLTIIIFLAFCHKCTSKIELDSQCLPHLYHTKTLCIILHFQKFITSKAQYKRNNKKHANYSQFYERPSLKYSSTKFHKNCKLLVFSTDYC